MKRDRREEDRNIGRSKGEKREKEIERKPVRKRERRDRGEKGFPRIEIDEKRERNQKRKRD